MNFPIRQAWRLLAIGALLSALVVSCSSDDTSDVGGGGVAGGGRAGSAGTGGSSARGGSGGAGASGGLENIGGQTEAGGMAGSGDASSSAGAAGVAGAAGTSSVAGAGGQAPGGCLIGGDCAPTQSCTGGEIVKRCAASCLSDSDCHRYEYCAPNGACVRAAELDQPCSPRKRCAYGANVNDQLYCGPDGTCIKEPTTQTNCDADSCLTYPCADGKNCVWRDDPSCDFGRTYLCEIDGPMNQCIDDASTCPGGRCQAVYQGGAYYYCTAASQAGGDCGSDYIAIQNSWPFCDVGLYCKLSSANSVGTCMVSPGEGEDCLTTAACPYLNDLSQCAECAKGFYCSSGKCTHFGAAREDCTNRPCAEGLKCVDAHLGGQCTD